MQNHENNGRIILPLSVELRRFCCLWGYWANSLHLYCERKNPLNTDEVLSDSICLHTSDYICNSHLYTLVEEQSHPDNGLYRSTISVFIHLRHSECYILVSVDT